MNKTLLISTVFISMIIAGCSIIPGAQVQTDSLGYQAEIREGVSAGDLNMSNSGLPVKKLVIVSGNDRRELEVEIAATDAERQVGLMNRSELAQNRGMLFIFQSEGYINFWMKNTLIPLDMLFLDANGYVRHIVHDAQPCREADDRNCPRYNSQASVKYVLEINGGRAAQWNLRVGDKVTWL